MISKLILFFILFILYQRTGNSSKPADRKNFLITAGILLVLQSGLRNLAVGSDTYQYYLKFQDVIYTDWSTHISNLFNFYNYGEGKDPGYPILTKIFQIFLPDFRCFMIAIAALFFSGILKLMYRFELSTLEIFMAIALYEALFYSFFSITGLRQTIAASVCLWVIPYAINRKLLRFIIPILLASSIHKSALVFVPFYIMGYVKKPKWLLIGSLVLFIPMWIGGQSFVQYLIRDSFFDQYEDYLEGYDTQGALTFALFIVVIAIMLIKKMPYMLEDHAHALFMNAIAFAVFYTPMTSVGPSQMRIVQYYSILVLILLPKLLRTIKGSNFTMYATLLFVLYALYKNHQYCFFWQPMPLGVNYYTHQDIVGW